MKTDVSTPPPVDFSLVLGGPRMLPLDRHALLTLAIVVALPYLPLTLTMMSLEALVSQVIGKLLGW